ncbi:LysR family transcriptional regulator ArgP [Lysobacter yananisis]|uniref:HTH-type transcriptional regulator LysG n=2 Tax=Lysobacter TaxID=68 RepID=A0A0S2DBE9_LYSEN|nr:MULTISPECIES: LysR family transcriptional regulator ArgP [Lysobacter]ALN55860.1 chromosome replication initiation inhibitor [Lysobacter enzymogenes]WMT04000.1 LysR family transcriptional regulator ArgP [Lysobacter yananisis]
MDLLHPQLAAFAAVLEEGSFEAAARRLSVTASAVSQRIKALEDRLGQVLVVRQAPCRPTRAGERLLRRVRPMQALEAEALADFLPEDREAAPTRPVVVAVNDDSLDSWFLAAMARLHRQHGYLFDIRVDDQDHTLDLLRNGTALGAITAEANALQGCNVHPLGVMRYRAIASPQFAARHFADGMNAAALARAPMIVFNRKDELQWRYVRRITRARLAPPVHYVPTSTGFVEASALGLGWCLAPESLTGAALRGGRIVLVDPGRSLDVPLYWQHAAVRSSVLQRIGAALREAATEALRL